jgi:hypothetical protein
MLHSVMRIQLVLDDETQKRDDVIATELMRIVFSVSRGPICFSRPVPRIGRTIADSHLSRDVVSQG